MLALARLLVPRSEGSDQDTLVVDNSTPENEDSIAFAQPHLNPLLVTGVQPPVGKTRWCDSEVMICCPRQ